MPDRSNQVKSEPRDGDRRPKTAIDEYFYEVNSADFVCGSVQIAKATVYIINMSRCPALLSAGVRAG